MKILIIGGTRFLGRFLVEEGLSKNHEITLFNRGNKKEEFPHIEQVFGDRNSEMEKLKDRKWDAVIDTCGYVPQSLEKSISVLGNQIDQYVFISTISVYKDFSKNNLDEDSQVLSMTREEADGLTKDNDQAVMSHYGELKALCEQTLLNLLPNKGLIIRPGLIVGPYDYSDRFTYWVHRVNEGGKILAPGNPDRMIQFIDVRDLAKWIIEMIENKKTGVYNATGINKNLTMGGMLELINKGVNSDAEFIWANDNFLLENEVGPWIEMPLWLPEVTPDGKIMNGMLAVNIDKALSEGLVFRPVEETAFDTLEWFKNQDSSQGLRAGISKVKESQLLGKLISGSAI